MNIGVFDSGLGGLLITRAILEYMPEYNLCYLGDTASTPYGSKSKETVLEFTKKAVDYLFKVKNCKVIIIACNTATFAALKKLQTEYIPNNFPDRRVLGVIIPTLEKVAGRGFNSIGLLATNATVSSDVYGQELKKLEPLMPLYSCPAPLLVPLIENDADEFAAPIIAKYIETFKETDIDAIILGCTHYPHYKHLIKEESKKILGRDIEIISQDEFIPQSLEEYFKKHPEIEIELTKNSQYIFEVTDLTETYISQAAKICRRAIKIDKVDI